MHKADHSAMKLLYSVAALALISYRPSLATSEYSETSSDFEANLFLGSFGDSAAAFGDRSGNITANDKNSFYNGSTFAYMAFQSVVGTAYYALMAASRIEGLPKAPDVPDLPLARNDLTVIFGNMGRGLSNMKDKAGSFAPGHASVVTGLDILHTAVLVSFPYLLQFRRP